MSANYLARRRSVPRSTELLAAVRRLDSEPDVATRRALAEWIAARYEEREGGALVGLFSRCHLGHPYVDHSLSMAGLILEHFTAADALPTVYRAARGLAANGAYEYVEVYSDGSTIPVRTDGRS